MQTSFNSPTLRPIAADDRAFLLGLYGSTREKELAQLGFSEGQKQHFIAMQFFAQHNHYQEHYPAASFDIVLIGDEAVGRLYVDEWENEIRIVDISLLPQYCNKGIGSSLLKDVIKKASESDKCTSMHVEISNPALRLYERLGFEKQSEQGIYHQMKWHPSTTL